MIEKIRDQFTSSEENTALTKRYQSQKITIFPPKVGFHSNQHVLIIFNIIYMIFGYDFVPEVSPCSENMFPLIILLLPRIHFQDSFSNAGTYRFASKNEILRFYSENLWKFQKSNIFSWLKSEIFLYSIMLI